MIVDGFDYGDDWAPAGSGYERDRRVQWWDIDSKSWRPRWPKDSHPDHASNYAAGFSIRQKYRRPMTDAEKQAEKAKEEKVTHQHFVTLQALHYSEDMVASIKPQIPLSEAARVAQLPEVVAEVERQRKEKEIKAGDWYCHKGAYYKCKSRDGEWVVDDFDENNCKKQNNPVFIAFLEAGVTP